MALHKWISKSNKAYRIILIIVAFILGCFLFHDVRYAAFNTFKHSIQKKYPLIDHIGLRYVGGTCTITVEFDEEDVSFDSIEPMFLDMLLMVNKKPLSNFLVVNPKHPGGSWAYFNIVFLNPKAKKVFYKFSASQNGDDWFKEGNEENQVWKVNGLSKQYRYSDYMTGKHIDSESKIKDIAAPEC